MVAPTLDAADTAVDEGTAADRHLPEQRARLSGLAAICRVRSRPGFCVRAWHTVFIPGVCHQAASRPQVVRHCHPDPHA
jgi:hypothetical protein